MLPVHETEVIPDVGYYVKMARYEETSDESQQP
jgi:hypothetical protein